MILFSLSQQASLEIVRVPRVLLPEDQTEQLCHRAVCLAQHAPRQIHWKVRI